MDSITFREPIRSLFTDSGVTLTPTSCLLLPIVDFSVVKKTTIQLRSGKSYDAAVFVLPIERLGKAIQDAPYGEEAFCTPPPNRTIAIVKDNPRTTTTLSSQTRYPLTWTQLRFISEILASSKRPRKDVFNKAVATSSIHSSSYDNARRQYYSYINGPLDDTELTILLDAGVPVGKECTIDDIATFLPDDIRDDPSATRRVINQWKATTGFRDYSSH